MLEKVCTVKLFISFEKIMLYELLFTLNMAYSTFVSTPSIVADTIGVVPKSIGKLILNSLPGFENGVLNLWIASLFGPA